MFKGIRDMKFHAVGLDVYEEESDYVFENLEDDILQHSITARLLSFPNVIVTSHQGFLTKEALTNIADTTIKSITEFFKTGKSDNELCYRCGKIEGCKKERCDKCF